MPLLPKVIIDLTMTCQETLCLTNRFKLAHLSLLLACLLVRYFSDVVLILLCVMLGLTTKIPQGSCVTAKFIGHDPVGLLALALK